MACGPLTLSEAQGSWGHGPVHEYGAASAGELEEHVHHVADYEGHFEPPTPC